MGTETRHPVGTFFSHLLAQQRPNRVCAVPVRIQQLPSQRFRMRESGDLDLKPGVIVALRRSENLEKDSRDLKLLPHVRVQPVYLIDPAWDRDSPLCAPLPHRIDTIKGQVEGDSLLFELDVQVSDVRFAIYLDQLGIA